MGKFWNSIEKHNIQLNIIAIWLGLAGTSFFTMINWCDRPKDTDILTAGIYDTPFWSKLDKENSLSLDLRLSNQGTNVCIISKIVLYVPYNVKGKHGKIDGFAATIEATDSSSKETVKEIVLQPGQISKKRFLFVYKKIGGNVSISGVNQDSNFTTEASLVICALDSKGIKYFKSLKACRLEICNSDICGIEPIEKNMVDVINEKNKESNIFKQENRTPK